MTHEERIKAFIIELEHKFDVNHWGIGDIKIWPMLRIMIFMHVVNKVDEIKKSELQPNHVVTKQTRRPQLSSYVKNAFKYYFWLKGLKVKKHLFVSSNTYRVDMEGKRFNRFFDSLVERFNLEGQFQYLEYEDGVGTLFYDEAIGYKQGNEWYNNSLYKVWHRLNWNSKKKLINLDGYNEFVACLKEHDLTANIAKSISYNNIQGFYLRKWFFLYQNAQKIIKRTNPQYIHITNYYNEFVMLLVNAANKNNIVTIEMQHGPMGNLHLAYCNWTKIPSDGYGMLPRQYWCWDQDTKDTIDNWLGSHDLYTSFVGGHPWIDFWKKKKDISHFNLDQEFVLFSVQPEPFFIITPQMIEVIKKSQLKWYVRLHPRQMYRIKEITQYLNEIDIYDYIELEKASETPLPLLLSRMTLQITANSGTTIEAAMFGRYTILIDEVGCDYYKKTIDSGLASYINPYLDTFEEEFNGAIELVRSKDLSQDNEEEVAINKLSEIFE